MESMKSILPGLILLASVFAYISYGRSKSWKKEYGSLPPSLTCGIIGDYGCAAKCTILCALHECESVTPRCEGHYCNCYEESSSNAAPVVSRLPNDQNYEFQRAVLTKVSSQKREGTKLPESVARYLRETIEDFQDGPQRFIDIRNSTSLLVSDFEANEWDTYSTENYRQDEKVIRRINGFTGRRLLQIDEPVTPAMTVEPIARKVKIERIKKWRKKARMGGPDDDNDESEEVEPVPSPPPKPAEKRRVKIKQPSAENSKLTETGTNDDAVGMRTDFTAETFAVPREIAQHEGENNPEFEGQPPAIEPEDIRHPSIENEVVLMEKESTVEVEHRDPVENQEIVVDSPTNETALVKPRVKKSRTKNPKPTKSGPKIQRVKKYRRKNKPAVRRRIRKRKETPKETDDREAGDSQNSGLAIAEAILDGNPSLPSSPAYLNNLESTSDLSPSQKTNAAEPMNEQSNAKSKVEEPRIRSENSSSPMNGSENQSVKPDERLRADPSKPRSLKKGETFVENIPGKRIPENGAKVLQPENLLDTIQSQMDEKGGLLKQLEPPNMSAGIPDFIEHQPVANNVLQELIESKIPKKKKTRSPLATAPIPDDAVKSENTQPQDRTTDGEKSGNSPLKKLQNIIARPELSVDGAQQILKKVLPALESSSNSTGQVTTDPPIHSEPYQSDGQIPPFQNENDLGAGLKNTSTGAGQPSASGTRAKKRMRDVPGIQSSPEPKTVGIEPQSVSTVDEPLLENNKPKKRKQIVPPASLNIEGNEDTANEPQPKDGTNQHPPKRRKSKIQTQEDLKEFTPQKANDTPPTVEDLPTPTKPSVGKTRRKKPLEIIEDILPAPEGTAENSPTANSITPSTSQPVKSKHRKKNEIIPEGSIIDKKAPSESPTTSDDPQKQRRKMRKSIPTTEIDTLAPIAEQTDTTPRVEDLVEAPTSENNGNPFLKKPSSAKRPKKPQQSTQVSPAEASSITPQPKPENTSPPRKRRRIIDKVSPSPELETKADGKSTPKIKQPTEEQLIDQQQSGSVDRPSNQEFVDTTPNLPQELPSVGPPSSDTHPKKRRPSREKVLSSSVNEPTTKPESTTAHEPTKDILTPTKNDEILNLETPSIPSEIHPKKRRRLPEKVSFTPENGSSAPEIEVNNHEATSTSNAPPPVEKRRRMRETAPSSHVPKMEADSQGSVVTIPNEAQLMQNQLADQYLNNAPMKATPDEPSTSDIQPKKSRQGFTKVLPDLVNNIVHKLENVGLKPTEDSPIAERPDEDSSVPINNNDVLNLQDTSPTPSEIHPKKRRRVSEKVSPEPESDSNTPKVTGNNKEQPIANQIDQHDIVVESAPKEPSANDIRPKKRRQGLQKDLPALANKEALDPEIMDSPKLQQPESFDLKNVSSIPSEVNPKKGRRALEKVSPEPECSSNTPKVRVNITNEEQPTDNQLPDETHSSVPKEAALDRPSTSSRHPKKQNQGLQEVLHTSVKEKAPEPENAEQKPITDSPTAQQHTGDPFIPAKKEKIAQRPVEDSTVPININEALNLEDASPTPSEIHPKRRSRGPEKGLPEPESDSNAPKVKGNNEEQPIANQIDQHDIPIESAPKEPSTNDIRPKKRRQGLEKDLPTLANKEALEPEIMDSPILQQPEAFDLENESSIPSDVHPKKGRRVLEKVSSEPEKSSNAPKAKVNSRNGEQPTDNQLTDETHSSISKEAALDKPSTSNRHPKKQNQSLQEVLPTSVKEKALEPENAKHKPITDSPTVQQSTQDSLIPAKKEKTPNLESKSKKQRQKLEKVPPVLEDRADPSEIEIDGSPAVGKQSENLEQSPEKVPIVLQNRDDMPKIEKIDSNPEVGDMEAASGQTAPSSTLNKKTCTPLPDTVTAVQGDSTSPHPEKQQQALTELLPIRESINKKAGPQITDHKPKLHSMVDTPKPKIVQGASESSKDTKPTLKLKEKPTADKPSSTPIESSGQQNEFEEVLPTTLDQKNNGESAQSVPTVLQKDDNAVVAPTPESTTTVSNSEKIPEVDGVISKGKDPKKKEKNKPKIASNLEQIVSNPDPAIADVENEPTPVTSLEHPFVTESIITTPSSPREPSKSDKKLRKQLLAPEVSPNLENKSHAPEQQEHDSKDMKPTSKFKDEPTADKRSSTPTESPEQQNEFEEVLPATLNQENNSVPTVLQKDGNAIVTSTPESTNAVSNSEKIPELDDVISKGKDPKKKDKKPKIASNLEKVVSNPDLEIADDENEISDSFDKPTPVTSLENPSVTESTITTPDSKHISSPQEPSKSDKKLRKQPLAPEVSPNLENKSNAPEQQEHESKDMKPTLKLKDEPTADKRSSAPRESPEQQNEFEEVLPATLNQENNSVPTVLQKDGNAIVTSTPESTNAVSNSEKIPELDDVISKGKDPKKKDKKPKIASNLEKVASNPDLEIADDENEISDSFDKPTPVTSLENPSVTESTITTPDSKHISSPQEPSKSDKKLRKQPLAPEVSPNLETKSNAPEQQEHESKDMKPTLKLKDEPTADKRSSAPRESPEQQNEFEEALPATLNQENNGETAQSMPTVLQKDDNAVVAPTPESTTTVSNSEKIPEVDDVHSKGKDPKKKDKKPKIASNLEKVASNPDPEIADGENEISDSFDKLTPVTSLESPSVTESTITTPSSPHEPSKSDKKLKKKPLAPEVSPNLESKSNAPEQQEHKEPKIELRKSAKPLSKSDHKTPTKTVGNTDADLTKDSDTILAADTPTNEGEQMLENITPVKPEGGTDGLTPPTKQQKTSGKPKKQHQTNPGKGTDEMPVVDKVLSADTPRSDKIGSNEQPQLLDKLAENEDKLPEQKTIEVEDMLNAQEPVIDSNSMDPINVNQTLSLDNQPDEQQQQQLETNASPSKNIEGIPKPKIKDPGQKSSIVPHSKEQNPALKTADPVVKYIMNTPGTNNPQTGAIPNTHESSPEKEESSGNETEDHNTSNPNQSLGGTSAEQDKINPDAPQSAENVIPPLRSDSSGSQPMDKAPTSEKKTHKPSGESPAAAKPNANAMSDTVVPRPKDKKLKDKTDVPIRIENDEKPMESLTRVQNDILDGIPSPEVVKPISKEPNLPDIPEDKLSFTPDSREGSPTFEDLDSDIQNKPQTARPENLELLPNTPDTTGSSETDGSVDDPLLQKHIEPKINLDEDVEVFESNENKSPVSNEASPLPEKSQEVLDSETMDNGGKPEDHFPNDRENSDPTTPSILPTENGIPDEFYPLPEDGIASTDDKSPDAASEKISDSLAPKNDDAENSLTESPITKSEPSDSGETGSTPVEERTSQGLADTARPAEDTSVPNIEEFDPHPEETSSEFFSLNKLPDKKPDETRPGPLEEGISSSNKHVKTTPPKEFDETNVMPDEEETSSSEFFSLNKPSGPTPSQKFDETNPVRPEEEGTSSSEFFTLNKLLGMTPSRKSGVTNLRPDEDETSSSEFFSLNKPVGTTPSKKVGVTDSEPNEEETSSSEFFTLNKPAKTTPTRKIDEANSRPDGEEVSSEQAAKFTFPEVGLEEETDSSPREDETPTDSSEQAQKLKPPKSLKPREHSDDTMMSTRHANPSEPADELEEPQDDRALHGENQTGENEASANPTDHESSGEYFILNKLMNKVKPLANAIPFRGLDKNSIIPERGILSGVPHPTTLKAILRPFEESNKETTSPKEEDESGEFFSFDGKASKSRPSENEFLPEDFDKLDSNEERESVSNEVPSPREQADTQVSRKPPEDAELFHEAQRNMDDERAKSDEEETYSEFSNLNDWADKMHSSRHSGWFKEFEEASR